MKFFVDANLPYKLVSTLRIKGYDVIHTDDLPDRERTTDKEIRRISVDDDRIIITKDTDFLDSHVIQGIPRRLLYVATGNISNKQLISMIDKNFKSIVVLFDVYNFIEIGNESIIVHEK